MLAQLHTMQPSVNDLVAQRANDDAPSRAYQLHMPHPVRIHAEEPYGFRHFIPEWAEKAGLRQADIARELGADKGLVSRWFKGMRPKDDYLIPLAALLKAPEVASLFRHPDDDWIARMFRDRDEDEKRRMIQMLEAAFPPKLRA